MAASGFVALGDKLTRCSRPVVATHSAVLGAAALALTLGVAVELMPRVGGDLVAQQWWSSWASSAGGHPVDLGWYAGSPAVSYSLLSPWVLALTGTAVAGALGTVLGATAMTALLVRARPPRPRWGGMAAAVTFAADQLSGRTTFAMGTALGLGALLVLGSRGRPLLRRPAGAVLAGLAGALSPVGAAFLGLAAAAWWLGGGHRPGDRLTAGLTVRLRPPPGRTADITVLLLGAIAPLGLMLELDAARRPMTASSHQMLAAVLAAGAVAAVLPRDQPLLRTGALLTVLALLLSWLAPDPLGSNTTRLVLLFAVPVLVGAADREPLEVGLSAALVVWLLPPVILTDLAPRDAVAAEQDLGPLRRELASRGPLGRVEVVSLASHQEALLAEQVPLARGWTRQLDVARNPLFYDGTLDADSYREWLHARGVSYVAVSDQRHDWAAQAEADLLDQGVAGLARVWSEGSWTLYQVAGSDVLHGAASLVASDRAALTLEVAAAGTVRVALFWNPRLTVAGDGACIAPGPEGTVLVRVRTPGEVVLSSAWAPHGHCTG